MTEPATAALDRAIIAAAEKLVDAHREKPRSPERVAAARAELEAARAARWPDVDA